MNKIKKYSQLIFLFLCFFLFSLTVHAGSANINLNGSSTVIVGNNVEVTLALNNIQVTNGIMGVQFKLDYDTSFLQYVSSSNMSPFQISYSDSARTVAGISFSSDSYIKSGSANLIKIVFKTKKEGNTAIRITSSEVTEGDNTIASVGTTSKNIEITPPPSSNANLSSLTSSIGSISFNKNTTSYNISVDGNTSSITIDGAAEDSGAKVSGAGTKTLNYGDNVIKIVVTAPSGATKTYTVTVNRHDDRSNVNTLKTLSVAGYSLSPKFNTNTTTYSIKVPHDVSSVNVEAIASDEKAKVSINGNTKLIAERTTNITITVTAENGAQKVYTIKAKREKDPNKILSTNNDLASLKINTGELTPEFSKDVTEYAVTVAEEIETIIIDAKPSDSIYGEVEIKGPETLKRGDNRFKIIVTAEDESTKTYTIIVTREGIPEDQNEVVEEPKPTLDLKEIDLTGAVLKEKFDPSIHLYHYKKNGDIKIDAILEDETNTVTVYEQDGIYTIMVENPEGEIAIYTLVPESNNTLLIVLASILPVCLGFGFVVGYKWPKIKEKIFQKDKK